MKPSCQHSWQFTGKEPHGEDRVISTWTCSQCGKTRTKNLKKPRFVPYAELLDKKASKPRKQAKTAQKPQERKRKAIRQVSDKRREWLRRYNAKKKADPVVVQAFQLIAGSVVSVPMFKVECEPHHGLARVGCRILFYAWTSPNLHKAIHDNPQWARAKGLLLPEYDGRESGPDQKDPLNLLPAYRAYVAEHGLH